MVDADYRGEVKVLLFNLTDKDFEIRKGDRISQMIIERYTATDLVVMNRLGNTERNEGGFGSTDMKEERSGTKKSLAYSVVWVMIAIIGIAGLVIQC